MHRTTMPHHPDRRAHAPRHHHARFFLPAFPVSPRRRVLTLQGAEALDEARLTTDLVQEARRQVLDLADRRRRAVLAANTGGASYRVIAQALGISVAGVQQLIIAARAGAPAAQVIDRDDHT